MTETSELTIPVLTGIRPPAPADPLRGLKRVWDFLQELAISATVVERNFHWLRLTGEILPFLDTDVLYGALLPESVAVATFQRIEHQHLGLPLDVDDPVGPHMFRYYLDAIERYSLPPGTIAEVLNAERSVRRQLPHTATRLLGLIDAARGAVSPTDEVLKLSAQQQFGSAVRDVLRTFVSEVDTTRLLADLVERNVPSAELTSTTADAGANRAFSAMLEHLNAQRPAADLNNYYDALNAATVVQVFNNSAVFNDSAPRRHRLVPVLVSTTKAILRGSELLEAQLAPDHSVIDRPQVVTNRQCLTVLAALRQFTGGQRYEVAADMSGRLAADSRALADVCKRLSHEVSALQTRERADGAAVADHPSLRNHWDMLRHKTFVYMKRWRPVLWPAQAATNFDRVAWINQLVSKETERRLNSHKPDAVRAAAEELRNALRHASHGGDDFWELLETCRMVTPPERVNVQEPGGETSPLPGVQISRVPNDGTPLTAVRPGRPLARRDAAEVKENHDFRVAVHQPQLDPGAIIAIDTWRRVGDAQRRVRVVWLHEFDAEVMITEAFQLLTECAVANGRRVESFGVRLSGRRAVAETIAAPATAAAARDAARALVRDAERPGYLDVTAGDVQLFADAAPLEQTELQAGLVCPSPLWSRRLAESVARSMYRSSRRLTASLYELILTSIAEQIGLPARR